MALAPRTARERRAWSLLHVDLLALLGLSISLALFNNAKIGLSTPGIYPFMLYLLVRMVLLGFGRGRPGGRCACSCRCRGSRSA